MEQEYGEYYISLFQSPFSSHEHYMLSGTCFPLIVYETEPISIVAYALNSFDYKKSFEEYGKQSHSNSSSPLCKKKIQELSDSSLDKSAGLLSFLRNKEGNVGPNQMTTNESVWVANCNHRSFSL